LPAILTLSEAEGEESPQMIINFVPAEESKAVGGHLI
jgi:hypothetical protein